MMKMPLLLALLFLAQVPPVLDVAPKFATDPVTKDADDPAIWIHPNDPSKSLIIGTDKTEATGGLFVFGLNGKTRQHIQGLDRPNNVDVEYGFSLGGKKVDLVVATERMKRRLVVYRVEPATQTLVDVTGQTGVFANENGERQAPMGIALYRRPKDGAVFAIVSPKEGPTSGYLGQYRLQDDGNGKVDAIEVRRFGNFSGDGEIEALVVDDEAGYLYAADEAFGIRKYHADPDAPAAEKELASFGHELYQGDREGMALYATGPKTGYLISSNQLEGNSEVLIYDRQAPHNLRGKVRLGADSTDGLEVTNARLPGFRNGFLVVMNSKGRNFLVADWRDIRRAIR